MTEDINELAVALAAAQAEMRPAPLNRINPHFKSKYADLAAVREATLPALNKHGLALIQTTDTTADGLFLVTRLVHKSGQSIAGTFPLPATGTPQQVGSALTYARRYAWASICGITADDDDDDDDGNDATRLVKGNGAKTALIDEKQIATLQSAIMEVDADLPKFLRYLKIGALGDLTTDRYQDAMAALEAKRKPAA